MCEGSIHTVRPRTCSGWCALACSYIPCVVAIALIAANIIPYHLCFLRRLRAACEIGNASFVYYYYCVVVMVFAEVMVYGNFLLAIFTCPGFVPHEPWSEAPVYQGRSVSDNPYEVFELDRVGRLRYCSFCKQFKPDQAHHCHTCHCCVYRMDHHCPWINNCVGRGNSKFFLLFVGYIPVGAFHIVLTSLFSCVFHFPKFFDMALQDDSVLQSMVIILSIIFSTVMGICFLAFALHFACMAYRGQTSVSRMIASKKHPDELEQARKRQAEDRAFYMFDLFGSDQRWHRMILPFKPDHDIRRAPHGYARRFGGSADVFFMSPV
ncbi:palmitoyl acyltransferase 12 [Leishmania donovani]|uniref:Palmitoyltransferase n=1 Tax=Leishmania donovani TaxID=5661 RepID=A0A6J8FEW9_LEIDO|nr:palmitoyl acyltransferase 12 [Leishmania donovani]VDZ44917.1 palmitoyl_acyltransferase_12_putative/GeneDB:LmjF.23.1420 [Leishmania donovani]